MASDTGIRKSRAEYMRQYMNDPDHPERKEKKRERNKWYKRMYRENPNYRAREKLQKYRRENNDG